jgi:hypothetical protein
MHEGPDSHRLARAVERAAATAETPDDLADTLVPLELTARVVLAKAYGPEFLGPRTPIEEKMDAMARAISALVPIFEHEESSARAACLIPPALLAGGRFKRGAREFEFEDRTRSCQRLAVRATDAAYVLNHFKRTSR